MSAPGTTDTKDTAGATPDTAPPPGALQLLLNGILAENPVFRLALSLCPAVAVTTTAGIPSCSIATAGRTAAGEQVPQAPLPEMIASQPFSFARAAICFA